MVRYFTDDEEEEKEISPHTDTTIESSIMNLMTTGKIVLGTGHDKVVFRGTQTTPIVVDAPVVESIDETSPFDTDGPIHDHGSSCGVIIVSALLVSMLSIGSMYITMGAYAYPEWP